MAWATESDLLYTVHKDSPVVPPDMLRLLWASTNRITRSGAVLGAEQQAKVIDALRAMTIDAAYQNFDEHLKGSLTEGKQADLVILDQNPLTADKSKLLEINVVETIARGKTVFKAKTSH